MTLVEPQFRLLLHCKIWSLKDHLIDYRCNSLDILYIRVEFNKVVIQNAKCPALKLLQGRPAIVNVLCDRNSRSLIHLLNESSMFYNLQIISNLKDIPRVKMEAFYYVIT